MMNLDVDAMRALLHGIVAGRTDWSTCLEGLSGFAGATGAVLLSKDSNRIATSSAVAETTHRYIKEGWSARDIRYRGIPKLLRTGIATDQDYATEGDFRRSDFYNEFLGPHDLQWCAAVAVHPKCDWAISFQRTRKQGPYTMGEQADLLQLGAAVRATLEVEDLLGEARISAALDAFEFVGAAALLFDEMGKVGHANARAEAMLTGPLRVSRGRLIAPDRKVTAEIERQVEWMNQDPTHGIEPPIQVDLLPRGMMKPWLVYICPVPDAWIRHPVSRLRVLGLIVDLNETPRPPAIDLQRVFSLTSAQAALALKLIEGASLSEAADASLIAKETARNHVKAIFEKTGTSRQSELIALLSRLLTR